jgi:hypothetical protein
MSTFNIKRIYFTLDYLRLHKLGRTLKLFTKNRQMLDHSCANDTKKGYRAYIHRMYHTFLKKDFEYITVVKPRNEFGYNFGLTDGQIASSVFQNFNIFENTEKLLLYIFRRFFLYGEYKEKIINYNRLFNETQFVKPRTKRIFYTVRLDQNKSCGYEAMKELYKVRDAHLALLNEFKHEKEAIENCIKKSIASIFNKSRKVKAGQKVFLRNGSGEPDTTQVWIIESVTEQSSNGFVEKLDIRLANSRMRSFNISDIIPVFENQSKELLLKLQENEEIKVEFLKYAKNKLFNSENFSTEQVFNFSKSFFKIEKNLSEEQDSIINSLDFSEFVKFVGAEAVSEFETKLMLSASLRETNETPSSLNANEEECIIENDL